MSTDKITAAKAVPEPKREPAKPLDDTPVMGLRVLSLTPETDDPGGDPYNHTGQFYIDALRKRRQSDS